MVYLGSRWRLRAYDAVVRRKSMAPVRERRQRCDSEPWSDDSQQVAFPYDGAGWEVSQRQLEAASENTWSGRAAEPC